jgi:putative FmdB family regulatory protein
MPTYGYRCGSCGHQFEIVQKITEDALKACPKCQGKLSKMVYPAGVLFKGSGYYTTDYKGKESHSSGNGTSTRSNGTSDGKSESKSDSGSGSGSGSETKTESKSESKSDSKSEGKSESKPAAKPESKSDSKTEKAS